MTTVFVRTEDGLYELGEEDAAFNGRPTAVPAGTWLPKVCPPCGA